MAGVFLRPPDAITTMTKKRRPPARSPTALHLERTHSRNMVLLDFASGAAMQYSQAVAERIGGLSVPASAIARRALLVYALHIEQQARERQAGDARAEWRALQAAAQGVRVADELHSLTAEGQAQAQALERIQALRQSSEGDPLPGFLETLHSPAVITARAAWLAELERRQAELLASVASSRWGRLKGLSKTLTAADASAPTHNP
jgi:hypothetical protein